MVKKVVGKASWQSPTDTTEMAAFWLTALGHGGGEEFLATRTRQSGRGNRWTTAVAAWGRGVAFVAPLLDLRFPFRFFRTRAFPLVLLRYTA